MFKWTVCDPFVDHAIDKGKIAEEDVLTVFRDFPWGEMLAKMDGLRDDENCSPPSLCFTNLDDDHTLEIVLFEEEKETLFYLFYEESEDDPSRLELLDQTPEVTVEILAEFASGKYDRLRARFEADDDSASRKSKPWWKFWS